MTIQLTAGDTYIPLVPVLDASGQPLTGYTSIRCYVMRDNGDQYDFNDSTFKASGWTTRLATMTQVDATIAAGWYKYGAGFDTTGLANGRYVITYVDAGTSAYGLPSTEYVQVQSWVATLITALLATDISGATDAKTLAGAITRLRRWLTWTSATPTKKRLDVSGQVYEVYLDDGTTVQDSAPLADASGGAVTSAAGVPARIG